MRIGIVLAALLPIGASTEDLKYELQVREAFTAFEQQVETIRTETGTTSADRLVPVLMARRSLWKATEGSNFYERLSNGFWVEQSPKGEALIYREITRTPEYVEIATGTATANTVIHLTEGTADVKQSKDRSFKTYYKGGWAR